MAAPELEAVLKEQPWSPTDATRMIREVAKSDELDIIATRHAREQMLERSLIMGDVLYVLKHGFVYDEPQNSTRAGCYKYAIQSRSPNSGSRTVRVIAIPADRRSIKIVTVMWVD